MPLPILQDKNVCRGVAAYCGLTLGRALNAVAHAFSTAAHRRAGGGDGRGPVEELSQHPRGEQQPAEGGGTPTCPTQVCVLNSQAIYPPTGNLDHPKYGIY